MSLAADLRTILPELIVTATAIVVLLADLLPHGRGRPAAGRADAGARAVSLSHTTHI